MSCSPMMMSCRRSCRHRLFVNEYRVARTNDELRRDNAVGAYGEESPEWKGYQPPPITFKRWLVDTRENP
jgi:hypothetical protein